MQFAENPRKVSNIVNASLEQFQTLYAPALKVKYPQIAYHTYTHSALSFGQPLDRED